MNFSVNTVKGLIDIYLEGNLFHPHFLVGMQLFFYLYVVTSFSSPSK